MKVAKALLISLLLWPCIVRIGHGIRDAFTGTSTVDGALLPLFCSEGMQHDVHVASDVEEQVLGTT